MISGKISGNAFGESKVAHWFTWTGYLVFKHFPFLIVKYPQKHKILEHEEISFQPLH